MVNKSAYKWKYTKIGGVTRISIETGEDIMHLPELDQKLWTVLSCPINGIEFPRKTLEYIDSDGDGQIRVNEVIAAVQWLGKVLKSPESLVSKSGTIMLDNINQETVEGLKVFNSASQILANLGISKQEISIDDISDTSKIFAGSKLNGDGVITEASADSEDLAEAIKLIADKVGKAPDRSGADGVTKELVEEFFAEAADFSAWKAAATPGILPYGDNTAAARDAFCAIKDKVADYFIRCKIVAMDPDTCPSLEIPKDKLAEIAGRNLSQSISEISEYPLARVSSSAALPLNGNINPAWEAKFAALKSLVLDADFPGKDSITEAEWNATAAKLSAYEQWMAAKKGSRVEDIGISKINDILASSMKADLLALIDKDLTEKDNAESIEAVCKFAYLHRDIYSFLRNYVTFSDFYQIDSEIKSIFQAGRLLIDQRECDLCIKVSDMAKHNATAAISSMFIIYCDCANKSGGKMTIAAVITDGDVDNISVGKNGIFYDRQGNDWNATIIKVMENPISVRQAFWSPYKKLSGFVEEQINKFAASKDESLTKSMSDKVAESSAKITAAPAAGGPAPSPKEAQPFDIAKFCGIFAAIGLALGAIGTALAAVAKGFMHLPWWMMILVVVAVLMLISAPSMIVASLKLRRRNLSPLLNANGWAINAHTFVNIAFGATLTKMAKFPLICVKDPLADKGMPWWWKLIIIVLILGGIFAALYFNNLLANIGLPYTGLQQAAPEAQESALYSAFGY